MIYTELTARAMNIAYNAHNGQKDKCGMPYIFHPIHLAESMRDEYSTCAALLHDVVEDTSVTLDDLAKEFPKEVVEAVDLLTHKKGEQYMQYIERLATNEIALQVKAADLIHNSDADRVNLINEDLDTRAKRQARYEAAKDYLLEFLI